MTNVSTCHRCGLPQFDGPYGYVGPVCKCSFSHLPYRMWPGPEQAPRQEPPPGVTVEWKPLTEADIRRIVREELARDLEERKAKMRAFVAEVHGADPDPINAGHTLKGQP